MSKLIEALHRAEIERARARGLPEPELESHMPANDPVAAPRPRAHHASPSPGRGVRLRWMARGAIIAIAAVALIVLASHLWREAATAKPASGLKLDYELREK